MAEITLRTKRTTRVIEADQHERLLYAALRAGLELPHECATGNCGSCQAELVSGAVPEDAWPRAPGKRYCLPNSRIMIHQPSGGAQGQATDIEIQAREILALRQRLNEIYAKHTGTALDVISQAVERDKFMTPDEAKAFGLIDEVVTSRPATPGKDGK